MMHLLPLAKIKLARTGKGRRVPESGAEDFSTITDGEVDAMFEDLRLDERETPVLPYRHWN
jgi:hypothetical protein